MLDALSTKSDALTLHFPPAVRVAGETLTGSVDLHFARAQEENIQQVRVKLRGSIVTCVPLSHCRRSLPNDRSTAQTHPPKQWPELYHVPADHSTRPRRPHPLDAGRRVPASRFAPPPLTLYICSPAHPPAFLPLPESKLVCDDQLLH